MRLEGRRLAHAMSRPLGAVRMTEAFLPDPEATSKQLKALRKHVASELDGVDWLAAGNGSSGRVAGIGGTVRNLAVAAQRRAGDPDTGSQGYVVSREALGELVDELASRPAAKRGAVPGIKPDRGDVILAGAAVVAAVMDEGGFDALEVTDATMREGIFFERLLRGADPPLLPDVRRASVENLARRFDDDETHVRHVARLSLEVYDGLAQEGLLKADDEERDLLWAASLLHDIGAAIDYDDHHRHSRYLVISAGLPGWSPRELLLIGLIVHYHRKGDPDASALGSLARKGDARRVALLAGIIRLAEQLERSRDQSVRSVRVADANGAVRLEAMGTGDITVALWAARRSADLLGRAVDRELEVSGPG
jgi:exopolyphosphatase/guanosine-5'-triphosphate,3'-diphosphate pyrophosphatase